MTENGLQSQLRGFGIDVGGSGIKGALVDLNTGQFIGERIRIATPKPATPDAVADVIAEITHRFEWDGPVGITLPSVIQQQTAKTAPILTSRGSARMYQTSLRIIFQARKSRLSMMLMQRVLPNYTLVPQKMLKD